MRKVFLFICLFCTVTFISLLIWLIWWRPRDRRPREDGFKYVYVNQDGTVRELAAEEIKYLEQKFHPADGGRPYTKFTYESRDGWGSLSGFILRTKVPLHLKIEPVNPNYAIPKVNGMDNSIQEALEVGDIVTRNPDGSITIQPNPNISKEVRFAKIKKRVLDQQAINEEAARVRD